MQFKEYSTLNGLPNNDVQTLFQDSNGFVWVGTKYGLFRYDGYGIQEIKSNLHNPSLLTSNNIQCITEDKLNRLWIGTDNGFNVFNKKTRAIEKIIIPKAKSNNIARILILDNDNALIGTENGLYRYQYSRQAFIELTAKNTAGVFNPTTVKSLLKDSRGDVWIGTWIVGCIV
ncbi:DNA-binding response regulator, AraC family [Bacteroides graminisolvens DSM 19988 = JCM 15093]|uniref:DNA-binding response regulator, AraC family n=1 Tax=Bacteroides graminisolvens DSM 19988 = JCM 15093 TaxID=1121097 RepID=A0A069DBD8_9BACE|nr:DNA-binding response regulator, AraC family [Bacteroides graminisolvens DSM 19988 = JCM 15093]